MNRKLIEECFRKIIFEGLGCDPLDPNLIDTPKRVAKMYCDELFSSLNNEGVEITVFPNQHQISQIILSDKIFFSSTCSHHLVPFSGYAWVMYIPDKELIGLSKMTRVIEFFSKAPQIQEELTQQVLNFLVGALNPKGMMVVMRAKHQCMICRGVKQTNGSGMITSAINGAFNEAAVRKEGMDLIHMSLMMD